MFETAITTQQDLACIIVHHGAPATTRGCVVSLLSGLAPERIIVVNNAEDAEAAALAGEFQRRGVPCRVAPVSEADAQDQGKVRILPAGSNLGFARGCNIGIEHALRSPDVRWLWLLNNDTLADAAAPRLLRECLERNPRAIIGTAVVRHDTPDRLELALGCRFSPATSVLRPCSPGVFLREAVAGTAPRVDYVYGASLAFPATLAREVGPLSADFFLYYEEFDLCLRARAAGYSFHWCPAAVVRHGTARASRADRKDRAARHYHETLSTFLFLRRHYRRALWTALPFRTIAKLVLLPLRGEAWLLPSYFSGVKAFFRRVAARDGDA